jgi:hypothetical protein
MAAQPKVIQLNLSPAATVHREKLLLRQSSGLPKGIIPLPNFNFVAPFAQTGPGAEKAVVKSLLQGVSLALLEAQERRSSELTFASLVKFSFKDGKCSFQFYCPYAEIVQRVVDFKINRPDPTSLDSLEINYKFSLMADIVLPLVFVFDKKARQLLITNENHINSPEQFLDPERCRLTSGFLNFIGTLSLLNAADAAEPHVEALVKQVNLAIDRGVDEWLRWLYCFLDTRKLYETKRVFVSQEKPEEFYFSYP